MLLISTCSNQLTVSKKNSFYLPWNSHFLPHWIFICMKSEIHLNNQIILPRHRITYLNKLGANWGICLLLFSFGLQFLRKKTITFWVLYFFSSGLNILVSDCFSFTQFPGTIYTFYFCIVKLKASPEFTDDALGGDIHH